MSPNGIDTTVASKLDPPKTHTCQWGPARKLSIVIDVLTFLNPETLFSKLQRLDGAAPLTDLKSCEGLKPYVSIRRCRSRFHSKEGWLLAVRISVGVRPRVFVRKIPSPTQKPSDSSLECPAAREAIRDNRHESTRPHGQPSFSLSVFQGALSIVPR